MTITMYDAITLDNLPSDGKYFAGYVGGNWVTYPQIKARFPGATVLSIAINASETAQCLDIETGDAVPADAPAWVLHQKTPRPCLYASVSTMNTLISILNTAGISRASVRLWSAHYTHSAHICGPSTCNQMSVAADGTQWTDNALGKSLDQSLLNDDFFGGGSLVTYSAVTSQLPQLTLGMKDADLPHWYVRRVQAILNYVYGYPVNLTGVYDAMTVAAVKLLQAREGLTQDGVCGPVTWAKLVGG